MDSKSTKFKSVDSSIEFVPHKYQAEAVLHCIGHKKAGLFLDPGLGKTAICLKTASTLLEYKGIDRIFVIAPLRVCHNVWPSEAKKWRMSTHFKVTVLHGPKKDDLIEKESDMFVINPEGLDWFSIASKRLMKNGDKRLLIVDESTSFKNCTSKRFKTLKKLLPYFDRVIILTGTPVPNGLLQLWSQMYLLDFGARLSKYMTHYRNTYFYPADYMGFSYKLQPGAEARIYGKINDIVMHKSTNELELPPVVYNDISVVLSKKVKDLYDEMRKELALEFAQGLTISANAAVLTGKLRQISNGGLYTEDGEIIDIHDEKTDVIKDLVEELSGKPLLVMYEFRHDLHRLQRAFPKAPYIGAGVSPKEVTDIIAGWNRGDTPVLFLQPQAGGHGLNLQYGGCGDIAWYGMNYDLELYKQANARVHRQGVKHTVVIHHLIAKGTVDEKIRLVLAGKDKVQNALLEALLK